MKRFLSFAMALALFAALWMPSYAVSTYASCAILMDADSRRILYAQNIHEKRLIASITKLMTALVAAEHTDDLDELVTIQPHWLGSEGSSIYLKAGEKITMKGLLYGLLLQSGNDAAMAIACHLAGDEASFVAMMNKRAHELGMDHTKFANPSGLNHEDHYSTAYDMALLAIACLENETVAEICATQCATVGTRTFYNHNKLLHRYEGCVGMKTGYTEKAGRTLVSAAKRDGRTLICVTLNDGNDWNDHEKLLDYGFEEYASQVLCEQGQIFGAVKINGSIIPAVSAVAAERVSFPLMAGEELECSIDLVDEAQAPVRAGDAVGRVTWRLKGQAVAMVELVCADGAGADTVDPEQPSRWFSRWLGRHTAAFRPGAQLI